MTDGRRYGYYPGCSLLSSAKEYDRSVRMAFAHLGMDLVELEDWSCCGAVHADLQRGEAAWVLPGRNLALAEAQGLTAIVTPCSGCYRNLRRAAQKVGADKNSREQLNAELVTMSRNGRKLQLTTDVEVMHPLYLLQQRDAFGAVARAVAKPLSGLRVAAYYGCMLTRPKDIFDSAERPVGLDALVAALGAEPVDYGLKAKCCGGAMAISHSEMTAQLTGNVLIAAKEAGADLVTLACPMCHTALDAYQAQAERVVGHPLDLPVLYFTQLMALAFGLDPAALGFGRHMVAPQGVLRAKLGL
jgi:heterodisulfide reductase subunit B2